MPPVTGASRSRRPARLFAPCPRGLESVLAQELDRLDARGVQVTEGGVAFEGDLEVCYRANLESRIASRVLWHIGGSDYRSEQDVYRAVAAIPWRDHFDPRHTIRVNVAAVASPLKSLDYITLRIKDAVCDSFRRDTGVRPSVDTAEPDVRIHAFLEASRFTLYLDTSGEPLFKRGHRRAQSEAPLRENLAAGILALSGWRPGTPLLDPMCGGGTLLLEAALMALQIAPGSAREFAFQKLKSFDARLWESLQAAAQAARLAVTPLPLFGADLYGAQLKLTRENFAQAGLESVVTLKQANVLELPPPATSGVLVANPPYGVRLGEQEELARLYPQLGDVLKRRYAGWRACIFTADMRLPKLIGLKPARRIPLYNGALECRLYVFEMVSGSMRRKTSAADIASCRRGD